MGTHGRSNDIDKLRLRVAVLERIVRGLVVKSDTHEEHFLEANELLQIINDHLKLDLFEDDPATVQPAVDSKGTNEVDEAWHDQKNREEDELKRYYFEKQDREQQEKNEHGTNEE